MERIRPFTLPYLFDIPQETVFARRPGPPATREENLRSAEELTFAVLAYVFMPDHVHLLIRPLDEVYDMSAILQSIKQGPSQIAKAKGWIETVLWEAGGGHDSNIDHPQARPEAINYIHQNPVRKELVEDPLEFRWSSTNWFVTGEVGDINCLHIGELWS